MAGVKVLETERLALRRLTDDDAGFVHELVNEPSWIRFIGDRGVRSLEDARAYLDKGPLEMYRRFGFGLWVVELKETGEATGLCGLIKRDALDPPPREDRIAFRAEHPICGRADEALRHLTMGEPA